MVFIPDREELSWAAGLFDGEGYVGYTGKNRDGGHEFQLVITQVDRRVLDRFARAVNGGRIYGPYPPKNPKHQPKHRYADAGHPRVQAICAMLWFKLSPIKRDQFLTALTGARPVSHRRHRPHMLCPHGKRLWKRGCEECTKEYFRQYYIENPEKFEQYRERARHLTLVRKTAVMMLTA